MEKKLLFADRVDSNEQKGVEMYYPEEVIEEVRTRNDIVDIVSQYVNLQKKRK